MIQAFQTTLINAPLEVVAEWFRTVLPDSYLKIHPIDHVELTLLTSKPVKVGSRLKLRENIGGKFYLSTTIRLTELTPSSFAFVSTFPYSLVNVRARFSLRVVAQNQTEVLAENYGGWDRPIIGLLLDLVITHLLPEKVLKRHMKEENDGIKKLVEAYYHDRINGTLPAEG